MSEEWSDAVLAALSPRDIASYLKMRGWRHVADHGRVIAIFAHADQTEELRLPVTAKSPDFARRMHELVINLANSTETNPREILTDFTLAPFDVVRVRSPDADDYGSVRLEDGLDLHYEARNLVIAAANAAASPEPRKSWRGRRFDEVTDYLENVRLGQTEHGSFVLTVLSPWNYAPAGQSFSFSETFGRRVTKTLSSALAATEQAIRQSVSDGMAPFLEAVPLGVSANLCQALANLAREGGGADVSVSWSPSGPPQAPVTISLRREDAGTLTEAAKELGAQEPDVGVLIEGKITQIAEAAEQFSGDAVLEAPLGNLVRKIAVTFSPSERELVWQAGHDKSWVKIVGDLAREGRRLRLLNPRDISIIEPTEEE